MRYFRLRREFQVAYVIIGLVFLGVSFPFWAMWEAPGNEPWTFWQIVRNASVAVLGVLLILRPWRNKLGIDEENIWYADGILPARVLPLAAVRAVYSNKGKRMIVYLKSGGKTYIEHTFEGLDDFLARLAESGVSVLDRPLRPGQ